MQKIVNGHIVHEISLTEFRAGLFQLASENQNIYTVLLREFEKRALEEVIQSTKDKNSGKSRHQIIFERMRRREAKRHHNTLNKNMRNAKRIKYSGTSAHHVVAWNDKRAVIVRAILSQFGIEIDDAENGVMLPSNLKHIPHKMMPNAYAHATIHTQDYYVNITILLQNAASIHGVVKEDIVDVLQEIAQDLQTGKFPINSPIDRT